MKGLFAALVSMSLFEVTDAHGRKSSWVKPNTPTGVTAKDFVYFIDGASYTGYVAFPTTFGMSPTPGVLIAHQWYGLGDMEVRFLN